MIWWNWRTPQRLAVIATMIGLAAIVLTLAGGLAFGWKAVIGGTSFLFIPQMAAWLLFVGLKTGRMPSAYGRSELRSENPLWFWLTGSLYAGLFLFMVGFLVSALLW